MLSVLIPVYNVEKYLSRCIDSILAQTYRDIEIVLVDDGSTDSSGKICDEYTRKYSRIRVIHKENGGLGSARIAGIENATGEYIALLDSDDYIECDMYEKLILPFLKNSTVDISIGGYVMENFDYSIICPFVPAEQRIYPASQAISDMFANIIFNWSLCDKVYRKSLFKNTFPLLKWPKSYGEDTFVNWKLFQQAQNVAYQPLYGHHYCTRAESLTRQIFSRKCLVYLDIWNQILEDPQEKPYANDVIRIMLDYGAKYIFEMQKDWEHYEKEIEHYRALLNKHIAKYNYPMGLSEQWRMGLANRSREEYFFSIKKQGTGLCEFISRFPHIFIYGAGTIANEIAEKMELHGNVYDGFVVSETSMEVESFHGKPVISVHRLAIPGNDIGFIVALNQRNETAVRNLLESMGYGNLYFAGRESYLYV